MSIKDVIQIYIPDSVHFDAAHGVIKDKGCIVICIESTHQDTTKCYIPCKFVVIV